MVILLTRRRKRVTDAQWISILYQQPLTTNCYMAESTFADFDLAENDTSLSIVEVRLKKSESRTKISREQDRRNMLD